MKEKMKKTICSALIALSMFTAAYANGSVDDLACKQDAVYTSGDICEWGDDSIACPSDTSHYERWVEVPELNLNEITVTLLATLDDTSIPVTNALVILNGKNLGYTDSEGLFTYTQNTEKQIDLEFRVINQGLAGKTEIVSVIPGDDLEITLPLSSSDVIEDFELEGIPEIITEQSQFSAVFVSKFGDKANISSLIEVLAIHEATGGHIDVDEFFALTDDGKIELIDAVGLNGKLSELPDGALSLHFVAQDEDLLNYTGKVDVLHDCAERSFYPLIK